jgi:hypothetical protein
MSLASSSSFPWKIPSRLRCISDNHREIARGRHRPYAVAKLGCAEAMIERLEVRHHEARRAAQRNETKTVMEASVVKQEHSLPLLHPMPLE